jgi:hypothetical protein
MSFEEGGALVFGPEWRVPHLNASGQANNILNGLQSDSECIFDARNQIYHANNNGYLVPIGPAAADGQIDEK